MKENSTLRAEARASLKGNWGTSALYTLVYLIITSVIGGLCGILEINGEAYGLVSGDLVTILICLPISYGYTIGFLHQFRGQEQQISMLFSGFKSRIWSTMILNYVYIILWTLLLIIPGIIKAYSYAMTPYILNDEPELKNNAAIEKSMAMMKGHKMKLFLLDLSFIGWVILSAFTLFIGLLWVNPYMQSARVAFYEDLKKEVE